MIKETKNKNKEEIKKTKEMQEIEEMSDVAGQICGQDGCCGMGCEDCPCNNGGECMREAMCDYEEFDCGHDHDLEDAEELAVMGRPVDDFLVDAYHEGDIKKVMLSDYEDKWVVLFFYPADFTFVCPTELEDMADYYTKFQKLGAEVLAISTDTAYSHKAWHDTSKAVSKVKFPMLADPTHELAEYYRVEFYDGWDVEKIID